MGWIDVAHDGSKWQAVVNAVLNFGVVPRNSGNLFES
jgi:hypothetical protein